MKPMRSRQVTIFRPLLKSESIANKLLSLLTYYPIRLTRGALFELLDSVYPLLTLPPGEKLGWFLSNAKIKDIPIIFKLPDGSKFTCSIGDMSSFIAFIDIYDHEVYERFYKPRQGDMIFDIGAHIGVFAIKIAKSIKKAKIVAVEPDSYNFNKLMKNIRLNRLDTQIYPQNIALSNENGYTHFYRSPYFQAGSTLLKERERMNSDRITVKTKTLGTLTKSLRIKSIDLLKMDVEGAELKIMESSQHLLRHHIIKNVAIAIYHITTRQRKQIVNLFNVNGYSTFLSEENILYGSTSKLQLSKRI